MAVEKLVHPASGTLHFPVSLEEMLESTKRYKQEYFTKAKESRSFTETSEEEEVNKDVHNRAGSNESEQATSHINNASSSSEEAVIVYENKMEVEDDSDETDESEEEDISENDVISVHSEESDSSVKNKVSLSYELSKMLSKTHDDQEVTVVNISESDEEFQHKEERSASSVVIRDKSGSCSNVEVCERDMSKTYSSRTDSKIHSTSPVSCKKEQSVTFSADSRKKVATSRDLGNEDKLISDQQQKKSIASNASANNRYENIIQASTGKGSKDIATSIKTSTANKTRLVTENEEEKQDDDHALHIHQKGDDNEPNPKKIKLDSPESVKKYYKSDTEIAETGSQSKVKNSTAVPVTGNGRKEQPVNGVAQDPKDVTEEEMLQAFVDALSE
jgi:Cu/Zn superoxide dismutase